MAAKNTSTHSTTSLRQSSGRAGQATLSTRYQPQLIEPKWQKKWEEEKIYQPDMDKAEKPFYNLMMFPYPSAEGLHVGNVYAFTGADVYGRFKRMQGNEVFEPIGLDGFGIHAENYALKIGKHPMDYSKVTETNFYRQLHVIGNGFDWSRTVETYKPNYYAWTQWLFIKLFKAGLAYRKKQAVNYCPSCKTVLADEQVINSRPPATSSNQSKDKSMGVAGEVGRGKCERCGSVVEKRDLAQWFFKITDYADRLLNNIEKLNWTERVKIAQREWIGKKEGINIDYKVERTSETIRVFTTRPDTNFGATFIALAPEHPLVGALATSEQKEAVKSYVEETKKKPEQERIATGREKTGVFTGSYAINALTGYSMPIWVSDFVLMGFGTGALVGVPGHDKRDFEFAQKFGLEVKRVVVGKDKDESPITSVEQVQEDEGVMVNSDFLNGMEIHAAIAKIMDHIEEKGMGKRQVTYHLRDWLISRQRYWGAPIPMIYCESCAREGKGELENTDWQSAGWYSEREENLPVTLPYVKEYKPLGKGKSPLALDENFVNTTCPCCGKPAKRETDVSDTFLDSAWYFFRYTSTEDTSQPWKKERVKKWLPVHMYIGGAEHSVLHLLYSRFMTMAVKDMGLISHFEEPYQRFYAHGLLIKEGSKMSKSKGNIVIPDEYIVKYGADTLRTYLMFLGPYDQGGDFRDTGIEGMHRFLKRVWTLLTNESLVTDKPEELRIVHKTIKEATEEMEDLRYNVVIAKLMILYNFLAKREKISKETVKIFLKLLAPFAPHMTEELWSREVLRSKGSRFAETRSGSARQSIHLQPWPSFDKQYLKEDTVTIIVQVNGKVRDNLQIPADQASKEQVENRAKESKNAAKYLENGSIKKVIYISGKLINFVM
ncbi:MAG: leucine--tRNA ligase [Candidatus Levybacteria bacterium]|nr:leucine--tRNA ligase [Candidatus Levybacteria bacterium]